MPEKEASESKDEKRSGGQADATSSKPQPDTPSGKLAAAGFPIVGVGASAGGLEAFTQLLKHLPLDTGMGFVLVQHLDPQHESALTQILARATSMRLREVTNNLTVEPNQVYVIPPNTNLTIEQGALKLGPRPDGRKPHRSIDAFFESLAQDQRERAIGVILSGTATDGTLGLEAIKAEDGITFAQDDSAKYDSMPRSAVAAGCVDFVLKPGDIAKELARIAKHPYVAGQPPEHVSPEEDRASATVHEEDETPLPSGGHGSPPTGARQAHAEAKAAHGKGGENGFKKILLLLRNHCGVDFSLYKSTTIQRRITRRMVLNKQDKLEDYAAFLRGNAKELAALYSDVLISVTSFFRNPEAFDILERKVFPKLLEQRSDDPLRVWVLGCSTGQEAYSIVMAFMETAEKASRTRTLQVFATDLNDALLDKARHGFYAKSLAQDISPERLRRFFVEEESGYRIIKPLREMVVFARQNLIADPPFSRMDLISCRNLLIYLEPSLQQKALPTFHYALKPEGFLFLGASESVGSFTELFEPVDKKHKIYSRKAAPTPAFHLPEKRSVAGVPSPGQPRRVGTPLAMERLPGGASEGFRAELSAQREADRVTVNQFAPPGVLVNAALQILQFRGPTSAYLEPPTGKASFDVLKMAREGLMLPLRAAINKAKKENKTARKENVRIQQNGGTRMVNVEVIPLKNLRERCFLILFEDARAGRAVSGTPFGEQPSGAARTRPPASKKQESRRVSELETDLSETRDYLQSIQEQHEAANEELQASNEEVQSSNEELQSVNEELETSKEELESANEELTTVNEEMANRNVELSRLNSDLANLQNSAHLAIVLIGRDLTVRRFSVQAEKQLNLLASDVGRPIGNIRHNLVFPVSGAAGETPAATPELESLIAEVIASVRERECDVRDKDGRWYSLRVRPYLTLDSKVDGAVLVLVDIDAIKRNERIQAALDFAQSTVDTVRESLLVLDGEMRVRSAGRAFYQTFRVAPEETIGRLIFELGNRQWNIPALRKLLEKILPQHTTIEDFELVHEFEQIGQRTMLLNARVLKDPANRSEWILLAIEDITERNRLQQEIQSARLAEAIIATARDPLVILEADLRVHSANESFYNTFKITPEQTKGRLIYDLGNGQWNILKLRQLLEGIMPRNSFFNNFEVTRDFDGIGHRTMLLSGRKLAGDGAPERIFLGIQDITEVLQFQTAARESEARKDAILKSALDAIITMDHEGRFVEFNPAAEKLFGYSRAEALGKPLAELIIPAPLRERHNQGLAHYLATGEGPVLNRQIEMPALRADGTEFPAELAIIAIPDTHPPMFTCFLRDITERKKAQQALVEQAHLLNLSNDAIIVRDVQDRIVYWNHGAEELYGWSREEALGKVVHSLLENEFPKPLEQIFEELHQNDRWVGEIMQTKRDGQRITVLSRWAVDRDKDGNPVGVLAVNTDITARKGAEKALQLSEAWQRLLFESVRDFSIFSMDNQGRLTDWNPGAERFFGYTSEEILGQHVSVVFTPEDRAARVPEEELRKAESEGFALDERWHLRKNGERFFASGAMRPLRDDVGKLLGFVKIARDITERKRNEEALRKAQEQLADRAGQLEQAVAERTAELSATNKQLEAFIYSIAHDLRAPGRSMEGFSALLLEEAGASLSEAGRDFANRINRAAQFMDALLMDLLAFSSTAQQRIELAPVKLETIVQSVLSRLEKEIQDTNARVETFGPWPTVLAHESTLGQVLFNLVSNALKFVAPDTSPVVRVRAEGAPSGQAGCVRVVVEDEGIGIAPNHQEQIFQLFTRLQREQYPGTGVGLAIVQKGIERMGGRVGVESTPGQGSRFWFELPTA